MPQYKLTYFNAQGRAEVARMLFAVAGQQYEDCRLEFSFAERKGGKDFEQLKPVTPFGQLPLLDVDGQIICQSRAICRYLARQFGLAGTTDWDKATADMIVDQMEDLIEAMRPVFSAKAEEDKVEDILGRLLTEYAEGPLARTLTALEKILASSESGYFVGDQISWADISFYKYTQFPPHLPIQIDGTLFPRCVALQDRVQTHPAIAEWIKKRPETPY